MMKSEWLLISWMDIFLLEYTSFPAVIRVSAIATIPSLTVIPKQYVIR
jgi:hypothetical protein